MGDKSDAGLSRDEAAALLWSRQHAGLVRLAVGLSGDAGEAEEIVQDAFATLLRRWWLLRDPANAEAYLRRVVVNGARSRWRRRVRLAPAWSAMSRQTEPVAEAPDIDVQLDFLAALARLPYGKRACVVLRYYVDLSEAETAAALGVSLGTVKSQTAKGLRQLAVALDEKRSGIR